MGGSAQPAGSVHLKSETIGAGGGAGAGAGEGAGAGAGAGAALRGGDVFTLPGLGAFRVPLTGGAGKRARGFQPSFAARAAAYGGTFAGAGKGSKATADASKSGRKLTEEEKAAKRTEMNRKKKEK
jgi:hypothetical protein